MEIICGLISPSQGQVFLNGTEHTKTPPRQRDIGYVPQDIVLFPNMTVENQISLPLKARRWSKGKIQSRIHEIAELLFLESNMSQLPQELSGGERQRVALGRALSFKPKILALDEPLTAIDAQTREDLINVIKFMKKAENTTVFHISHDMNEADQLADRIMNLSDGKLEEFPKN